MTREISIGDKWLHVKSGNTYLIHSETILECDMTPLVNYYRSDGSDKRIWSRPRDEFLEQISESWGWRFEWLG